MTNRSATTRPALLVMLALLLSGCMLLRRGEEDGQVYEPAPITVMVANRNWSQVAIYAEIRGQRRRIGEVTGASSAELTIPDLLTARTDMRLVATPLASNQTYRTGNIVVPPGAVIQLTIENDLRLSSWTVR